MNTQHAPAIAHRLVNVTILAVMTVTSTTAQQEPGSAAPLPPYRPPALALVQPAAGGSLPQDRPVVVFRFAPGEPNDPIDAGSFEVTVNGQDRTALFQVTLSEAWGPLASAPNEAEGGLAPGPHKIEARVCSVRGACREVTTLVTVTATVSQADETPREDRRRSLIDVVLTAVRKLLIP